MILLQPLCCVLKLYNYSHYNLCNPGVSPPPPPPHTVSGHMHNTHTHTDRHTGHLALTEVTMKTAGTCANIQKHKCTHLHMWKHCIFIFGCSRFKPKSPLLSQVLLFRLTWFLHPLSRTSTHTQTQNTHILFQHRVTHSTNTQRHMHID